MKFADKGYNFTITHLNKPFKIIRTTSSKIISNESKLLIVNFRETKIITDGIIKTYDNIKTNNSFITNITFDNSSFVIILHLQRTLAADFNVSKFFYEIINSEVYIKEPDIKVLKQIVSILNVFKSAIAYNDELENEKFFNEIVPDVYTPTKKLKQHF